MTRTQASSTDLSPQAHSTISDDIIAEQLAGTEECRDGKPAAIILAGQPGAGKSGLCEALAQMKSRNDCVLINVDALRYYDSRMKEFNKEDDLTAAEKTQHDASRWADELCNAAIAGHRNLIIEGTLKSPENTEHLCERLRRAGYHVEVRALAVPPDDSRLGIYWRYERGHAKEGYGRWVPEAVHDKAVVGMPESLRRIESCGLANRVTVYHRGSNQPAYDNPAADKGGIDGAARYIKAEHSRVPTLDELREREAGWNRWRELAKSNGNLEKAYAQHGLDLCAQAQINLLVAQYQTAKANGRLDTPEAQRLLAERAKVLRVNRERLDHAAADPGFKGKAIGQDWPARREPDREP